MARYVSDPISLPQADGAFSRADLIFTGVDHSGPSFEARVYLENPDADEGTPLDPENGYAGSFYIFGHGGCFGDEGHCEVPTERDPFDYRPPHPLTPITKTVIATDAVQRHAGSESVRVTVVPVVKEGEGKADDVLSFDGLRLVTYEGETPFTPRDVPASSRGGLAS
jgi:tyrosinase